MTISIAEATLLGTQVLTRAGVPEPRKEAGSLLAYVTGKDKTFLISHADDLLSEEDLRRFRILIERRASGEPQQYITGRQDFFGREFKVTADVLIPRPETELLVEAALRILDDRRSRSLICDVGTGSGCIVISLLSERQLTRAIALDVSPAAIKIAMRNAIAHSVINRLSLVVSDCFDALTPSDYFDLIVSNPPYVSADVLEGLQREVKDHEPLVALTPGKNGLSMIQRLLVEAPRFLKPMGHLVMEIGFDQSEAVGRLVNPAIWNLVDILPDLQGIPRIAILQKTHS